MTAWGSWICPNCGCKWNGSVGYLNYCDQEKLTRVLRAICPKHCTDEHLTPEDTKEMMVYTIGNIITEDT